MSSPNRVRSRRDLQRRRRIAIGADLDRGDAAADVAEFVEDRVANGAQPSDDADHQKRQAEDPFHGDEAATDVTGAAFRCEFRCACRVLSHGVMLVQGVYRFRFVTDLQLFDASAKVGHFVEQRVAY